MFRETSRSLENDGWCCVLFRSENGVELQARSGRLITPVLPDLVEAALQLPVGAVLDGECVVYTRERLDFYAMQRRALSSPRRAVALAHTMPVSYGAFDCLAEDGADLRARTYDERRAAMLRVLDGIDPPIQATPVTTDPEAADEWFHILPEMGVEGLVIKHRVPGLLRRQTGLAEAEAPVEPRQLRADSPSSQRHVSPHQQPRLPVPAVARMLVDGVRRGEVQTSVMHDTVAST